MPALFVLPPCFYRLRRFATLLRKPKAEKQSKACLLRFLHAKQARRRSKRSKKTKASPSARQARSEAKNATPLLI
jgi:hypothetical protein